SLAGRDRERLNMIPGTLDRSTMVIHGAKADVIDDPWIGKLSRAGGGDLATARAILESMRMWQDRLAVAPPQITRWLCHGHIGYRVLWHGFGCCAQLAGADNAELDRVTRAHTDVLLNALAFHWAQKSVQERTVWPRVVFSMLGLAV